MVLSGRKEEAPVTKHAASKQSSIRNPFRDRKVLSRALRGLRRRRLLTEGIKHAAVSLFFGLLLCFGLAVLLQFGVSLQRIPLIYTLILLIAAMTGFAAAAAFRTHDLVLLVDADRHFGFRERLSTAYDISTYGDRGSFSGTVLSEAEDAAEGLNPKSVYPIKLSPLGKWIPIAMVLFLAGVFVDLGIPVDSSQELLVREEGRSLEDLGEMLAARAEQEGSSEMLKLGEDIARLGLKMQADQMNRQNSRKEISELIDRIEKRKEELSARLNQTNAATKPDGGQETTEGSDTETAAGGVDEDGSDGGPTEPEARTLVEAEDNLKESLENLEEPAESGTGVITAAEEWDDPGKGGREDTGEDQDGVEDEPSGLPGKTPVEDQPLEEEYVPGDGKTEDKRITSMKQSEEAIQVLLRILPDSESGDAEGEAVLADYEKQVEEAILKELIPQDMERYIRSYFLDIGITGQ